MLVAGTLNVRVQYAAECDFFEHEAKGEDKQKLLQQKDRGGPGKSPRWYPWVIGVIGIVGILAGGMIWIKWTGGKVE